MRTGRKYLVCEGNYGVGRAQVQFDSVPAGGEEVALLGGIDLGPLLGRPSERDGTRYLLGRRGAGKSRSEGPCVDPRLA